MFTIDPRGHDVHRWTSETGRNLAKYGTVTKLVNPDAWQQWAANAIMLPAVAAINPPRPERFGTWQEWAFAFNLALFSLS
jgi:hypothetical protein